MLKRIRKYFAIKAMVKKMPVVLKKRYGRHKRYSGSQVRKAAKAIGLSDSYVDYAYAIYVSKREFQALKNESLTAGDYSALRKEVADAHFGGDTRFTIHDLLNTSVSEGFWGDPVSLADTDPEMGSDD